MPVILMVPSAWQSHIRDVVWGGGRQGATKVNLKKSHGILKCGWGEEGHADLLMSLSHHRRMQIPNKWTCTTYAKRHTKECMWTFSSITPWGFNFKSETQDFIYLISLVSFIRFTFPKILQYTFVLLYRYTHLSTIQYPNLLKQHF